MSTMDTDNENTLLEKSSSFASGGNGKDNNIIPPDPQDKDNDIENAPPPDQTETPKLRDLDAAELDHHPASDAEKELPQSEEINGLELPTDETSATAEDPSPLPPDLDKVSEEVDQYISCLSSSKGDEISRTPPEEVPICVEQFAVLFEAKIEEYDSSDNPVKWTRLTDEDSASFLDAAGRVSKLYASLCGYSSDYKFAYSINRIGSVLQRTMTYLEEEFRSIIEDYQIPEVENHNTTTTTTHQDSSSKPSSSSTSNVNNNNNQQDQGEQPHPGSESDPPQDTAADSPGVGYSDDSLSNLSKLSKAMIAGGYETECCQVYFIARRNALGESLHKLGFEKHSIDDVQKMNWESLEREIEAWIKTFKQFAATEFYRERKLSESVFLDYPLIAESIFCNLSRGVILQLVNFSEAVAMTKRAAEKLFKFLDIYETLRDVFSRVDGLFPAESVEEIKSEAMLTRSRLGEAMICIICELENSIKADTGKTTVPGGAVHPLTRYIMNYLKYACDYKDTLEQVFREHQKIERADSGTGSDFDYNAQPQNYNNNSSSNTNNQQKGQESPFQVQLVKVMDLLDANLEAKSKLYRDLSLSSIFMMNNGRYILQKIKGSAEINSLMGDTCCRKRSTDLRQYHKNYQRETWGKLLNCLINHEGLNVHGKVAKPVLKERFKSFNAMFDEIHKTQGCWVVSDEQLQSELRVSISNMVIPAYRAFLARYGQTLTPGRQTEKYVKYQPEDIETYVDELFDGNSTPTGRRRV